MFLLLRLDRISLFLTGLLSLGLGHFLHLLLKTVNSSGKGLYVLIYVGFHRSDFRAKLTEVVYDLF